MPVTVIEFSIEERCDSFDCSKHPHYKKNVRTSSKIKGKNSPNSQRGKLTGGENFRNYIARQFQEPSLIQGEGPQLAASMPHPFNKVL